MLAKVSVVLLLSYLGLYNMSFAGIFSFSLCPSQDGSGSLGVTVETFPSSTGDLRHGIVLVKTQM